MNESEAKLNVPRGNQCPDCGMALPANILGGLCPACLLKEGAASATYRPASPFEPLPLPEVAQLFPQLEILGLLGKGGMGAVYKARQPALNRFVALKILQPPPGRDPGFAERFTREARALAQLSHPNIVAVYDFGQAGNLHYFIMEYVDGLNLRQLEKAPKLASREALEIIPQICEALQFAHDEGIVHRDIKPENVLIDRKGRVKIADFGLAKILGGETPPSRLTGAGHVVGTPHYMAPEQVAHPQSVDHRADIYSLGVVFYEMLTGELPLGRFAPPSQRVQIDVRLDEVVLRALENAPELRYTQVSQLKTQIQTIAQTKATSSPPPTAPQSAALPSDDFRENRVRQIWNIAGWHALLMLLFFGFSAWCVPLLARPFADVGLALPLVSTLSIQFANAMRSYWFVLIPLILGVDIAICILLQNKTQSLRACRRWSLAVTVSVALAAALIATSLYPPSDPDAVVTQNHGRLK